MTTLTYSGKIIQKKSCHRKLSSVRLTLHSVFTSYQLLHNIPYGWTVLVPQHSSHGISRRTPRSQTVLSVVTTAVHCCSAGDCSQPSILSETPSSLFLSLIDEGNNHYFEARVFVVPSLRVFVYISVGDSVLYLLLCLFRPAVLK